MVVLQSWPFSSGPGASPSEDRYTEFFQFLIESGVLEDRPTDLFRLSGAMAGELEVFADSTGMQVKIRAGRLVIAGHPARLDAQTTEPVTPAHATLSRIDTVVARLNKATGQKLTEIVVVPGTPASVPVGPTLTQTDTLNEMALADVAVGPAVVTMAPGNVTNRRVFARARMHRVHGQIGGGTNVFIGEGIGTTNHPGTGRYAIGWSTPFSNADYTLDATPYSDGFANAVVHTSAKSEAGAEIWVYDAAGTLIDVNWVSVIAEGV